VETDVRGALDAGIDAVLVETGLDRLSAASAVQPTFRLLSLEDSA
jgi:ribonucleotide monophosphatase NagD (HAD superfamily)